MVYLFLADGFEEIEALTPVDYLRRAGVEVKTVTISDNNVVKGARGVQVLADIALTEFDIEKCQMIVLPGGLNGMLNLKNNDTVQNIIKDCIDKNIYVASICASPTILGEKGYLKDKNATCYKGMENELVGANVSYEPVVQDGIFITGRGAGVSNQFSFKLIELLCGKEKSEEIKDSILWQ